MYFHCKSYDFCVQVTYTILVFYENSKKRIRHIILRQLAFRFAPPIKPIIFFVFSPCAVYQIIHAIHQKILKGNVLPFNIFCGRMDFLILLLFSYKNGPHWKLSYFYRSRDIVKTRQEFRSILRLKRLISFKANKMLTKPISTANKLAFLIQERFTRKTQKL